MRFKEYKVRFTTTNGALDSSYIWPVLTDEELTSLYDAFPAWKEFKFIDEFGVTSDGSTLLALSGIGYAKTFFEKSPQPDLNTEYLTEILSSFPNIIDLTSVIMLGDITETTDTFAYRSIETHINDSDYVGRSSMYREVSDIYRSLNVYLGTGYSGFPRSNGIDCTYGSGTGGNSAGAMNAYLKFLILAESGGYIVASLSGYRGSLEFRLSSLVTKLGNESDMGRFYLVTNYFLTNEGADVDPTVNDPYNVGGGESGTGGGAGDFDGKSDSIDIPDLPTASATDAGFITLFNPSLSQMRSLAAYMWSNLFDLDGWRKLFANPMDAILGLSIVPVTVPSGGSKEVKVGNIGTGVTMTTAATQYVAVDCGTLNVNEYWGAYLDYEPFTKAEIYLPYIGTHAIAVDDIMGKAVHVVYHVDILSGACCAYVKCGSSVLYSFIGQCSSSIPITGDNWTNVVNGVLNIAGSIGSMVATGGASAPLAIGEIASTSVNAMKPSVEKSGSMSGTGGMMAIQTPYLILTRPRQAVPKNQNKYTGYPAYITRKLSTLKGYTEIESIRIEGVYATDSEMSELYSLLASGVIF